MKYYFEKQTDYDFVNSINRIKEELAKEGFGILAEINMSETLKKKLDIDYKPYTILEACNPPFAYQSLQAEENIGIMLPCNIVIREIDQNRVKVSVVNPISAMKAVKNSKMDDIAKKIQTKLKRALQNV